MLLFLLQLLLAVHAQTFIYRSSSTLESHTPSVRPSSSATGSIHHSFIVVTTRYATTHQDSTRRRLCSFVRSIDTDRKDVNWRLSVGWTGIR